MIKKERAPIDAYIRTGIPGKMDKSKDSKRVDKSAGVKLVSKEELGSLLEKSKGIVKNNSKTQFIYKRAQN